MKWQIARFIVRCLGLICFISGSHILAPAQRWIGAKAGVIECIQGEVFLDGTPILLRDNSYIQMENGQILSTKKGYAELILTSEVRLRLGEDASLQMQQNRITGIQMDLNQGSALVEILSTIKTDPIKIHISKSEIEIKKTGLYRLDSVPGQLRIYAGQALAKNEGKNIQIKSIRMVRLDGQFALAEFDPNKADALHRWSARRSFLLFAADAYDLKRRNWRLIEGVDEIRNSNYRIAFHVDHASWLKLMTRRNWRVLGQGK
jgi:hypothetical protein